MDDLIGKIKDYQSNKKELLYWPYHNLLDSICNDIIEIVEGEDK